MHLARLGAHIVDEQADASSNRNAASSSLAAAAAFLASAAPALGGARHVPRGFMGVNVDGPLFTSLVDKPHEFSEMARSGVESIRFAVFWGSIQPYRSFRAMRPAILAAADQPG